MGGWPVGIRTKKACNLILEAGQSTGGRGQLQRNRPKRRVILLGQILREARKGWTWLFPGFLYFLPLR